MINGGVNEFDKSIISIEKINEGSCGVLSFWSYHSQKKSQEIILSHEDLERIEKKEKCRLETFAKIIKAVYLTYLYKIRINFEFQNQNFLGKRKKIGSYGNEEHSNTLSESINV